MPSPPRPAAHASPPDACLDDALRAAGLNAYGDSPGTAYAGGSPLFDEKTGRSTSRWAYVRAKHPELAARCPAAPR